MTPTLAGHALRNLAVAGLLAFAPVPATAGGVLTVAMTAGDIAVTTGTPDQGFEGFRFVAWSLYDALVGWDLSKADQPSDIIPRLATSWSIDPNDHRRWIFKLRQGVKFHDGCGFSADDVIWNYVRMTDSKAPQFLAQQFALNRGYMTNIAGMEKIDNDTIAITTKFVESLFPYTMSYVPMVSRCRAEELKYDWAAYAMHPSGTGPYRSASSSTIFFACSSSCASAMRLYDRNRCASSEIYVGGILISNPRFSVE